MMKPNLFGEWLLVIFVPSITLLLGESLAQALKEINLFWAIVLIIVMGLLYFAELYSLVARTFKKFGIKISVFKEKR